MTGSASAAAPGPQEHRTGWSWLLPAGTFLAGCALGATLVAVGGSGDDDEGGSPDPAAAAGTSQKQAGEEVTDSGGDDTGLHVRVPDSCLQTADNATTLVQQVDRMVAAVADLQPEPLRRTVDEVQGVREQVQRVAQQCQAEAARQFEDAAADEPTPAP